LSNIILIIEIIQNLKKYLWTPKNIFILNIPIDFINSEIDSKYQITQEKSQKSISNNSKRTSSNIKYTLRHIKLFIDNIISYYVKYTI